VNNRFGKLNNMGLLCCSEATRNNIWLWPVKISENGIGNNSPRLIKNKFANEAFDDSDVDYSSEISESSEKDSAIRHMLKSTPELPRLNTISKSEPVFQHQYTRQGFSLRGKMIDRNSNPFHDEFVEVEAEQRAKLYMNTLQDSSMQELTLTFKNAESMLEKGNEIHEEIQRQGEVVKQANRDIQATERDIHDTSHRLKGMKSLGGKFKNIFLHNHGSPEGVTIHESDDQFTMVRSKTLPKTLPSYNTKMTKQQWINQGVDRLCDVLEEVEHRQEDIGQELEEQEKHFQCLDHNIDHIEHKIHHQTKIMSNIRKK